MSDKLNLGRIPIAVLNAVSFVYLLGAFVAWDISWVTDIPNFYPGARLLLFSSVMLMLFVSCGIFGVFDDADKPANETDNG